MEEPKTSKAQRDAIKRYTDKNDRINIVFPAGTKERIKALGRTPTSFIKEATETALKAAERYSKK